MGILPDLNNKNNREVVKTKLEVVKTLGLVFTAVGLILTYWDAQEDRRLTQERLVTDSFSKAIEKLGEEQDETVRIGGIYALERIAKDSAKDYWTIMEILTSYVRENSSLPQKETAKPIDIDVQAAITVIGRRNVTRKNFRELEEGKSIDLTRTNLRKADLKGANLREADLTEANLRQANLIKADLRQAEFKRSNLKEAVLKGADLREEANFTNADLEKANFTNADLTEAIFSQTNLKRANFTNANLTEANLIKADLTGADLREANLTGANFAQTNLRNTQLYCANLSKADNLNIAQVKLADKWEEAIYDDNFRQKLQLPSVSKDNNCQ